MKAAIVRQSDGAVLARWEDSTEPTVFPLAPDGCEYVEVVDEVFDALAVTVNPEGRLAWQVVGGELKRKPRPATRPFFAIVETATRAVRSLDRAIPSVLDPSLEWVALTEADYSELDAGLLYDEAVPKWTCAADGTIAPLADNRGVLLVALTGPAEVGVPFPITLTVQDAAGVTQPFSGARAFRVETPNGPRDVKADFSSGVANVSPTLSVPGRYRIATPAPSVYRVAGEYTFECAETWA